MSLQYLHNITKEIISGLEKQTPARKYSLGWITMLCFCALNSIVYRGCVFCILIYLYLITELFT